MSIKVIKNFDTLKCSVLGKSIPIDHLGFTLFLGAWLAVGGRRPLCDVAAIFCSSVMHMYMHCSLSVIGQWLVVYIGRLKSPSTCSKPDLTQNCVKYSLNFSVNDYNVVQTENSPCLYFYHVL